MLVNKYLEVLHHGLRPGHAVVLGVELGDLLLPLLPRQLVVVHHHRGQEVVRVEVAFRVNLQAKYEIRTNLTPCLRTSFS